MLTGFTGPDEPSYQTLVKEFNDTHPDIQVTMTVEPWATVGQKLPASWATGQGPDLATPSSDPGSIFSYIKTNSVLPLDPAVGSGADQIDSAAFPPSVKAAFTVGGKLYAVPANMATLALYYNKDMFAAAGISTPPTTEDDLIADAKKLTIGAAGKPSQYGISLADNNTIQMWPVLQWMSGGDILDSNNCAAVNSAASVSALTTWSQLVAKDHISPVGQAGADADTLFASKKAAMEINGPWAAAGFKSAGINLGIAQVPVGSAGPVTLASTVPLMIERTTKHPAQAKTFLAWYTSKTAQEKFSQVSGFPPARTDLGNSTAGDPAVSVFAQALPHAKLYLAGQSVASQIDSDVYVPFIQKIERGAGVQSAADDAAKQINKLTGCKQN
ncbi:ABC transporter substrate-binding protein [Rugosimonospora africana]|uniref:ABC transporter substrate-binding protein n=1 Tax=Rugosimonospora africana TaxID=556532 RepID=A0A8J3QTS9_9ACTN|nr:ABC transporter substrate-binding protein [Rugosimonospora africana]GIH16698.1 ABC transporter substrate-binding protein [Rugosimonospora africana]